MVIYSPVISGSLIISGSIVTTNGGLPLTGSLVSSGSFTSIGPTIISGSLTVITGSSVEFQVLDTGVRIGNLATDNHNVTGSLRVSGSITGSGFLTTGTITAQTIVVQTITSSVDFVTGSTKTGTLATNTHQFTGSLYITGSVLIGSTSPAGTERFGVTRDDGVADGLHIIADFNRSGNSSAELILGYYATASAVTGPVVYAANSQPLLFAAGSGEKMRLTTAGNLVVGGTTAGTSLNTSVTVNNSSAGNYSGFIPMTADTQRGYYGGTSTGLEIGVAGTGFLGVWTAGVERMRIASTGNIGINTTSPVSTSLTGSLTIVKQYQADTPTSTTAQLYYANQSALYLFGRNSGVSIISNNNEEGAIIFGNASTIAYASIKTGTAATSVGGDMYFKVGSDTERMRITTVGRVGIGTNSPDTKLHIYDGTNPLSIKLQRTSVPVFFSDVQTAGTTAGAVWSHNIENTSNGSFTWSGLTNTSYAGSAIMLNSDTATSYTTFHTANSANTTPTERVRITGDGRLLIGQSVASTAANGWNLQGDGGGSAAFQVTSNEAFIFNNRTTGTTYQIDFRTNGVERGSINVTDASTSYATTSDYRIKEDFKEFSGLEKLTNIKVYDFKFKDLDERMDGVIAHELQEVLPYAVYGEKDGTKFQSVDYSKLVPVLVKSLQELKAENDTLKEILQRNNIQ